MDPSVAAAVVTGGAALIGSSVGLYLQARGQRIAARLSEAGAVSEARQDGTETVLDAWKRIVDAQDRRITRLEQAEEHCQEELHSVRMDLKEVLHANRP